VVADFASRGGVATFRLHLQVEPLTVTTKQWEPLLGSLVAFTVLALRDQSSEPWC